MSTSRPLLVALFLLVPALTAVGQEEAPGYWLIGQAIGKWEYRDASGVRRLTGKYDCLWTTGEVRCLEADPARCELRYFGEATGSATRKLPIPQPRQWVKLRTLPPPPPSVLPTTSGDLVGTLKRLAKPGGSRSLSGCVGAFPLRAPACGENIDVDNFTIRWLPPGEQSKGDLVLFAERADAVSESTAAVRIRRPMPASGGAYSDAALTEFLRRLQEPTRTVDVVVTVTAADASKAERLVHIPPADRAAQYQSRVKAVNYRDPLVKGIALASLALEHGMWSKAAEEASRVMDLAAGSPPLLEYIVAGMCQSDFEEDKVRLRKYVSEETYSQICAGAPGPSAAAVPVPLPSPRPADEAAGAAATSTNRLGIALLIGNWDYSGAPLKPVRNDLETMKEALENVGFAVVERQNLRGPQQFIEALKDALTQEKATSEDVLFVYYSGHGVQIDGKAHLLGTGLPSSATRAEDARSSAQNAQEFLYEMEKAAPGTRVLMVEACRDTFAAPPVAAEGRLAKGGFAFNQDEVPNTFVLFANKPGLPTPARSKEGTGGPFTDAFVYALSNSSGEIQDVYRVAVEKTREMSPDQEPDEHHSRSVEPVYLRPRDPSAQDRRARDLLNEAAPLYQNRDWAEFLTKVDRGRVLAADSSLRQRFASETEFATLVKDAVELEAARKWGVAAERWQKAGGIFPERQWATMNAAVAWLLADDLSRGVQCLAVVAAQSDSSETSVRAKRLLADLVKSFPALEAEARKAGQGTAKITGVEFEPVKHEE
jgi:hypothetical protein